MTPNPQTLRRRAKALRKSYAAGDAAAAERVQKALKSPVSDLRHADALHVLALEAGFDSWPKLKAAADISALSAEDRVERLERALFHGQHWVVERLLSEDPSIGRANFGLACALYDIDHVHALLRADPKVAMRPIGPRRPLLHLAFSKHHQQLDSIENMMAIAEALEAAGADMNDGYPSEPGSDHALSALYGALCHAENLTLGRWLLEHGADPNDNESLYHATEAQSAEALRLLLDHGARPAQTNALFRALDFNRHDMVRLLLDAGANPNEGIATHPSGAPAMVASALHQAARRMCDGAMARLLIDAGADTSCLSRGMTPYALARIFGNAEVAEAISEAGGVTRLSPEEAMLASAADGSVPEGFVNPSTLPGECRELISRLVHLPAQLPHIRRLVALGVEYDRPDEMGMTPLHISGWEGLPETMAYVLSLKPDMAHLNAYGGTLLSTIVHGSENCPQRASRDHLECARLALVHGVALPRRAPEFAGNEDMAAFLADWAAAYPGQVVEHGPV